MPFKGTKKGWLLVPEGYAQDPKLITMESLHQGARLDTIRSIISLAAQKGWSPHQLDVKSTFFNGVILKEEDFVSLLLNQNMHIYHSQPTITVQELPLQQKKHLPKRSYIFQIESHHFKSYQK